MHPCENEMVCKCTLDKIPHFNAPIYLQNKEQIGKIEEVMGPITQVVSLHSKCSFCIVLRKF